MFANHFAISHPKRTFANVSRLICKHFYAKYHTCTKYLLVYKCMYAHVCEYVMCVCVCVCVRMCMHVCVCVCMCAHSPVYACEHIAPCMHSTRVYIDNLFSNNNIKINIGMNKVSILISPNCPFDPHQTVLLEDGKQYTVYIYTCKVHTSKIHQHCLSLPWCVGRQNVTPDASSSRDC